MRPAMPLPRVALTEALGLSPLALALRQTAMVLRGDAWTPKSRFGPSSLRMLTPRLAVRTWLGATRRDRRIPILNLFNRTPTDPLLGWSVRVTQVRDFRGGRLTYDSHNGTDFVVPPGTRVCAAAPGLVLARRREFHRGGLKLYVRHAHGLVTTYNHLARALVEPGARVRRGEPIGLSGASGVDSTATFPWLAPHLHFNVWLNGIAADPFAEEGEASLWRVHNDPQPHRGGSADDEAPLLPFAEADVAALLAACRDPRLREQLAAVADPDRRGMELLLESVTYPSRFTLPEAGRLLYPSPVARQPFLDLPFHPDDFDGVLIDRP